MNVKHLIAVSTITISCFFSSYSYADEVKPRNVKNVIVMIPDGMSVTGTTLARLYKGESLAVDPLATGLMMTWNSDGTIADSAPAGSAISTGWKSQSGNIATIGKDYSGINRKTAQEIDYSRPNATVLEAAKLSGKSTGIISTSEFMHATPADFSAHDVSRKNYDNLTEQIVYNNLDVILGGGAKYLKAENRQDNEDMEEILISRGYSIVKTPQNLKEFNGKKLVGVFGKTANHTALSYDLDRDKNLEPSLADMTQKAIDILSQNQNGFFLMVEGSKVDWAAHANDPVGIVSDVIAFDNAVNVAVQYAKSNEDTLVIIVSDHGNSGISIGDRSTSKTYDKTKWTHFIDPLKKAKLTGEGFEELLLSKAALNNPEMIKSLAQEWLGVDDLTDTEVEAIMHYEKDYKKGDMNYVIGPIIAKRASIGFTTNGHTGEDVVLYSYDPRGRLLGGLVDNTQVADFISNSLGVDLAETTNNLFIDAKAAFQTKNANIVEDVSDKENPKLVVTKGNQKLVIPRNKSIVLLNDEEVNSDGVNVLSDTKWYVSKQIINMID